MTIDDFCKVFPKCPVCGSTIVMDGDDIYSFTCDSDNCFVFFPGLDENITNVDMIFLFKEDCYYEWHNGRLSFYEGDGSERNPEPVTLSSCDEATMIRLFKSPQDIEKFLLLS